MIVFLAMNSMLTLLHYSFMKCLGVNLDSMTTFSIKNKASLIPVAAKLTDGIFQHNTKLTTLQGSFTCTMFNNQRGVLSMLTWQNTKELNMSVLTTESASAPFKFRSLLPANMRVPSISS